MWSRVGIMLRLDKESRDRRRGHERQTDPGRGGTGAIWPAISFGRWIAENKPDVSVSYICGSRPLELEIYAAAGIEPHCLNIDGSPFSGSGIERLKRAWGQVAALRESASFIRSESPDFVLLFGGYVTFPVLLASRMLKAPSAIHEQNAYAGKVTRIASLMGGDILRLERMSSPACIEIHEDRCPCEGVRSASA